jgi:hypothetical protein
VQWQEVSSSDLGIDHTLTSVQTAEYEFFQFRVPAEANAPPERNSSSTASFLRQNPVDSLPSLTEGMFGYSLTRPVHNQDYYYGIFNACEKFRCNIEGWHTESGPGVFEAVRTPILGWFRSMKLLNSCVGSRVWRNRANGRQGRVVQVSDYICYLVSYEPTP